jgi:hypothetical protein
MMERRYHSSSPGAEHLGPGLCRCCIGLADSSLRWTVARRGSQGGSDERQNVSLLPLFEGRGRGDVRADTERQSPQGEIEGQMLQTAKSISLFLLFMVMSLQSCSSVE